MATQHMVTQVTTLMRNGPALARFLILFVVSLLAGAAPILAGKAEIHCGNDAAYAELKRIANNASPSAFTDILAQRLLAEDCYIEFVDAPPPLRTPKVTKRPAARTRGGPNVNKAAWDLADIVDHAARTIDNVLNATAAPKDHCTATKCGDDFATAGYQTE